MKIHSGTLRMFKHLDCPTEVPDSLLNEDWAKKIHSQTLDRLNERGGMAVNEILANIKRLPFGDIKNETEEMVSELRNLILNHLKTPHINNSNEFNGFM